MYPTPWRDVQAPEKPRIGVWNIETPNTFIHLFPPVLRGYKAAQDRLRAAGFELVEFNPPNLGEVWDMCKEFLLFEGIEGLVEALTQEPMTEIVRRTGIFDPAFATFPQQVDRLYRLNGQMVNLTATVDEE